MLKGASFTTVAIPPEEIAVVSDTQEVKKLLDSVKKYYNLQQLNIAQNYIDIAKAESEKIDYKEGLAIVEKWFGRMCADKGQISLAIEHIKSGLEIYTAINNYAGIIKMNNILGDYHYQRSDFNTALQYYVEALEISETIKDNNSISISHNNLGLIYTSQAKFEKAFHHYMESVRIKKKLKNNQFNLALTYNNIGRAYLKRKYYDSATYFADLAYKINFQLNDTDKIGDYYLFTGNISYEKGEYQNAEKLHRIALGIFEKNKNIQRSLHCKIGLAKDYIGLKKNELAKNLLIDVIAVASNLKTTGFLMDAYLNLSNIYSNTKEYGKALDYYKLYSQAKDSIFNEETRNNIIEINSKYEIDKKDRAMEKLNREKEKIIIENRFQISERKKQTTILLTITISLSVLLLLAYALYSLKKQQRKQKAFTQQLIQSQEDDRKRISKELHDGIGQNLLIIKNACMAQVPLIETTIEDLRSISRNMHPVQLEKLGFQKAVESIITEAKQNSSIMFTHEIDNIDKLLSPNQQINLYRIVQECISNIIKHSGTSAAKITIQPIGNRIVTTIQDKGKGFDLKEAQKKKSLGLTSIAERIELIDGKLKMSSDYNGTRIEITLKHA